MLAHAYPCNAKVAYNEQPEVVAEYTWRRPNTKTIPESTPPPPPPIFFSFSALTLKKYQCRFSFGKWQESKWMFSQAFQVNPIPSDSQLFLSFGFWVFDQPWALVHWQRHYKHRKETCAETISSLSVHYTVVQRRYIAEEAYPELKAMGNQP